VNATEAYFTSVRRQDECTEQGEKGRMGAVGKLAPGKFQGGKSLVVRRPMKVHGGNASRSLRSSPSNMARGKTHEHGYEISGKSP
jgi:hypothetical protein